MIYIKSLFLFVCLVSVVIAQIPNFGRCPNYEPLPDFDKENFLGKWYEQERYFTVTELASRCISVNYERRQDGKIYVNNELTNRFTGVQRIVSGVVAVTGKQNEGTFTVKYTSLPVNYDTTIHVLGTDYDSYAVLWSCSSIAGPVGHTESAWVMTRERFPDGPVLQHAYGILDKYKISRTFFVKTDQTDCETEAPPEEAAEEPTNPGYDIVVDDDTVVGELYDNQSYQNLQLQYFKKNGVQQKSASNSTTVAVPEEKEDQKSASNSTTAAIPEEKEVSTKKPIAEKSTIKNVKSSAERESVTKNSAPEKEEKPKKE